MHDFEMFSRWIFLNFRALMCNLKVRCLLLLTYVFAAAPQRSMVEDSSLEGERIGEIVRLLR